MFRKIIFVASMVIFNFVVYVSLASDTKNTTQVVEHRLNYEIIIPDKATAIQTFVANELKIFMQKIYSAPIIINKKTAHVRFFIGFQNGIGLSNFDKIKMKKQRFGIFRNGTDFLLTGYDDHVKPLKFRGLTGSLSAVYYFLNKYVGVDFFFPGEKGYSLNKNKAIIFKNKADVPVPSFKVRGFSLYNKEFSREEKMEFFKRMLCQVPLWASAERRYFVRNWHKTIGKTYPEYLAKINSKRNGKYPYHIPCTSNRNVVKKVANDVIDIFRSNPDIQTVALFCDGPFNPCQCKQCRSSKERKLQAGGDCSEEYFAFVAKIGKIVFQAFPEKNLFTITKRGLYCQPPTSIKWDPRIAVGILTNRGVNGKPIFTTRVRDTKLWLKAGARVIIRSYSRYPLHKDYPLINPKYTASYFRQFKDLASGSLSSDLYNTPYSFCALNQYVQAKILFDASLKVDDLIDQFVRFCFPGAEKEMTAFYAEMEKLWENAEHTEPLSSFYHVSNLKKALFLLEQAGKKIKGDKFLFNKLSKDFRKFYNTSAIYAKNHKKICLASVKTLTPTRLKTPVIIDGILSQGEWKDVLHMEFSGPETKSRLQPSIARLAYDKQNLYIGLTGYENNIRELKQSCHSGKKDQPVWKDDSFEIFLAPEKERYPYYQIVVNSLGIVTLLKYVAVGKPDFLQFTGKCKAAVYKDRYEIELKIPFKRFGIDNKYRFNIFRNRRAGDYQTSGLRYAGGSFHNIEKYHFLSIEKINK